LPHASMARAINNDKRVGFFDLISRRAADSTRVDSKLVRIGIVPAAPLTGNFFAGA
jgi:hypothetical protein